MTPREIADLSLQCGHRALSADAKKQGGVTYTPFSIAYAMVARVNPSPDESWLDPAIGRGMFLWATLQYFQDQQYPSWSIQQFLHRHMHACEWDAAAAEDTENLLALWCKDAGYTPPTRRWLYRGDTLMRTGCPKVDVLVGNPPYIRIQHLNPTMREQLREHYLTCAEGNVDIYYAFFEHALAHSRRGILIAPNAWLSNRSAATLRRVVLERTTDIVDFHEELLFAPVRAYTALWQWGRPTTVLRRKHDWGGVVHTQEKSILLQDGAWPDPTRQGAASTQVQGVALSDVADVYSGLATLADSIYTVTVEQYGTATCQVRTHTGELLPIETKVLVPLFKWTKDTAGDPLAVHSRAIIYPYDSHGVLRSAAWMATHAPLAWTYLHTQKSALALRDKGHTSGYPAWYAFGRSQGLFKAGTTHAGWGIPTMWSGPYTPKPIRLSPSQPYAFVSGYVIRPKAHTDPQRLEMALSDAQVWEQVHALGKMWAGDKPYRTIGAPLLRTLKIPYTKP